MRKRKLVLSGFLVLLLSSLPAVQQISFGATLPVPYLIVITFYSDAIKPTTLATVRAQYAPTINKSAYHGVAIAPVKSSQTLATSGAQNFDWMVTGTGITKQVWPWVFINRIIAKPSGSTQPAGFAGIKGMDVLDRAGALTDFYRIFEMSLAFAKKHGSPGVVFDPEAYHDYNVYRLDRLSSLTGISQTNLITALKNIGAKMTDIINATYPDAVIWSLTARFYEMTLSPGRYSSVTWIQMGMLDRAKETHSRMKLVEGGENSMWYCHLSLADLNSDMNKRAGWYAPALKAWPNNFRMGATISPWQDVAHKSGWLTVGECGASQAKTIAEFVPMFTRLMTAYDYVWIYAAG
ncbi:MAG: hypothetical protein HY912_21275, partial [Desulfomonile tiedjei]|nr:hypothetical protein [Desulfomonile tiedjei]